jgi:hypothetical protein
MGKGRQSQAGQRNAVGRIFFGNEDGDYAGTGINLDRSGWYAQAAWQITPQWTVAARHAALDSDNAPLALLGTALDNLGHSPSATSFLVEYDTSEFGRLRLQYTHDESDLDDSRYPERAGYTVIIGPHAAHRY